tara:strand:- start:278 stop:997 length:720 start_codon:yes stop_codon:yes gene_type:complete
MKIIVDLCNQHRGSLQELKRMAANAYYAGASAVKIQLLDSEKLLGTGEKKYRDISLEDATVLRDYCEQIGVEFMASVFDEERLEWAETLGVKVHKIASRTAKHDVALAEKILSKNKPTLISTGMHEVGEFPYGRDQNIDYLFCVSSYPTSLDDPRLAQMPLQFSRSGYTGYSDHTPGLAAALRAHHHGATVLEKHFSNNLFAQSNLEGGHIGSFEQGSLRMYVNLTDELGIMRRRATDV